MAQTVEFEFPDLYPGEVFTVQVSPVSMRQLFDFREAWFRDNAYDDFAVQVDRFVAIAHPAWTVTGVETFTDLDFGAVKALVNAWLAVIGSVPAPLAVPSSGGAQPPED